MNRLISTGEHRYTKLDPSASGGIKGKIVNPSTPPIGVFIVCPNQIGWCYRAELGGESGREFEITGLPMERYDLIILYGDTLYEGLVLTANEDTLTTYDKEGIEAQVTKSEPFFDQKIIFRIEGQTGDGEKAHGIAAFIRNKESLDQAFRVYTDHRRSIKVIHMMDVGPGWQMTKDREVYVDFVKPGTGAKIKDIYRSWLGGIRVTDKVKDFGEMDLSRSDHK